MLILIWNAVFYYSAHCVSAGLNFSCGVSISGPSTYYVSKGIYTCLRYYMHKHVQWRSLVSDRSVGIFITEVILNRGTTYDALTLTIKRQKDSFVPPLRFDSIPFKLPTIYSHCLKLSVLHIIFRILCRWSYLG